MKKSILLLLIFTGSVFAAESSYNRIKKPSNRQLANKVKVREGITDEDLRDMPVKGFFSEMQRTRCCFPFQLCFAGRCLLPGEKVSELYVGKYLLNKVLLLDDRPLGEYEYERMWPILDIYKFENGIRIKKLEPYDSAYKKECYNEIGLCAALTCFLGGCCFAPYLGPSLCRFAPMLCGSCGACSACSLGQVCSELQNVTVELGSLRAPEMQE